MATKTVKIDSEIYAEAQSELEAVGLDFAGSIDALFAAGYKRLAAAQKRANKEAEERAEAVKRLASLLTPGADVVLKGQGRRLATPVTVVVVTSSGKAVVSDADGVESLVPIHKLEAPAE